MPLRDHFRQPPRGRTWDEVHGVWPAVITADLNRRLPPRYIASAQVHLGTGFEVNVATFDHSDFGRPMAGDPGEGGVATATLALIEPTLDVAANALPDVDEYEVLIHDMEEDRRLVAAIEIVSPANEDRPAHRRSFVAKCATMLARGVCVAVVDLVTDRRANLYSDLIEFLGVSDPSLANEIPTVYAAACRWLRRRPQGRIQAWAHPLEVGQPLPTLPLWLDEDNWLPLDLEATYEQTCQNIRWP